MYMVYKYMYIQLINKTRLMATSLYFSQHNECNVIGRRSNDIYWKYELVISKVHVQKFGCFKWVSDV